MSAETKTPPAVPAMRVFPALMSAETFVALSPVSDCTQVCPLSTEKKTPFVDPKKRVDPMEVKFFPVAVALALPLSALQKIPPFVEL